MSAYDDGLGSFTVCPDCKTRDGRHLSGCPSDDAAEPMDEDAPVTPARRAAERADFQRAWHRADAMLHTKAPTDLAGQLALAHRLAVEAYTRRAQAMVDGSASEQAGWARDLVARVQEYHTLLNTAPDEIRRAHRREMVSTATQMIA